MTNRKPPNSGPMECPGLNTHATIAGESVFGPLARPWPVHYMPSRAHPPLGMSQHRPTKAVALYSEREKEAWEEAESEAREEIGSGVREGEVLAHICTEFVEGEL